VFHAESDPASPVKQFSICPDETCSRGSPWTGSWLSVASRKGEQSAGMAKLPLSRSQIARLAAYESTKSLI